MLFKLLIVAIFTNALLWITLTPIWQYPDEQAHFAQVQDIAEIGYVPVGKNSTSNEIALAEIILQTNRDKQGNNSYTYKPYFKLEKPFGLNGRGELDLKKLPPESRKEFVKAESTLNPNTYYRLAALAYRFVYHHDIFSRIYVVRLLSIGFYIATILVVYKTAKLVFSTTIESVAFTGFLAFVPMFVFTSTGILPDPLTNLLFTIVIHYCIKFILSAVSVKDLLITLVFIFVGVTTRQHFIIAFPILLSVLMLKMPKSTKTISIFVISVAILISIVIVSTVIGGDVIPFIAYFRIPDPNIFSKELISLDNFLHYFQSALKKTMTQTLPWYWGVYKWLSLTMPHVYYQIINRFILIILFGLCLEIFLIIKNRTISKTTKILVFCIYANIIYFLPLIIWDYFFTLKNGYSFGIQGRYFFPLIFPQIFLIYIGYSRVINLLFKNNFKYFLFTLLLLIILFNNLTLLNLAISNYQTLNLSTFIEHASQYKPDYLKGNIILVFIALAFFFQIYYLRKLWEGLQFKR
ncbi:MAG: DUF2142 domain-containing protein [Patescibacteria group bacterium]